MADRQVVVQPVLCFLFKKFGKCDDKRLITIALNFYSPDLIHMAKKRLIEDIEKEKIENIPSNIMVNRRDGKERCTHEINDIMAIVRLFDERMLHEKLPRYAAEDPSDLPSMGIVDGDMFVILDKLAQLEGAISGLQLGINTVYGMLNAFLRPNHHQPPTVHQGLNIAGPQLQPVLSSNAKNSNVEKPSSSFTHQLSSASMTVGNTNHIANNTNSVNAIPSSQGNVASNNQWSALMDLQSQSEYEASGDEMLPFSTVLSRSTRRAIARENRKNDSRSEKRRHDASPSVNKPINEPKKKERIFVIGNRKPVESSSDDQRDQLVSGATVNKVVIAAAPMYRKAVFCVDNVSVNVTAEDMEAYVKQLDIQVLTVHKVQPRLTRRERNEGINSSEVKRRAFRVCINKDDANKMTDPSNWSNSVSVSAWFFKPRNEGEEQARSGTDASARSAKKPRSDSTENAAAGDSSAAAATMDDANDY